MLHQPSAPLTAADLKRHLGDIQGGILQEYQTLACTYVFYRIDDAAAGRDWLHDRLAEVTAAAAAAPAETLNLAISAAGLAALGVAEATRASFPKAFRDGMAVRAAKLGDPDPATWEGGLGSPAIHVLAALSGPDAASVDRRRRTVSANAAQHGVDEIHHVDAAVQFDRRSGCPATHFGYVDPIAQPSIAGFDDGAPSPGAPSSDGARNGTGWRPIQPGEFLLGYVNELGEATATPEPRELGVNGTFIAFRKARQDVVGFRDALKRGALALWGVDDAAHQEKMAAKMVGRWRSGCPLALSPDRDDPVLATDPNRVNDFDHADDPDGLKCPLGAHIRRANPRSTRLTTTTDVNRKRLLRRGLEYGPPLPDGAAADGIARGQAGVLIVADLELQFEFIQAEWFGKGDVVGLDHAEKDPLIGANGHGGQFTVPGADMPFLFDLRQFVTLEGGEYFFAPSLTALRGLAAGKF